MLDALATRWLDLVAPAVLLVLHVAVTAATIPRWRALPHAAPTLLLALAPAIYGIGVLLMVTLGAARTPTDADATTWSPWLPGGAVAGLGPLSVPFAACLIGTGRSDVRIAVAIAGLVAWALRWLAPLFYGMPDARQPELVIAAYFTSALLVAVQGLRQRAESGLERRVLAALVPAIVIAACYMAVKPPTVRASVASTLLLGGGELALLPLLRRPRRAEALPSTAVRLGFQTALLALGALLVLVGAANLGLFPKAPVPLLVATLVASGLSLGFALLQPSLDLLLRSALYPEAAHAAERVRALEQELTSARERLREVEHLGLLGQLAAEVAHEIKNPLGPIKGYAKIIERDVTESGAMTETVRRGIAIIREEVEAIDARVRGLLESARPPEPRLQPTDAVEVVSGAIDLSRAGCGAGTTLAWRDRPAKAMAVRCDPLLLRSALVNVLQNAGQALAGRMAGKIHIDIIRNDSLTTVIIDDDGPGLPEGDPESLFRPFASRRPRGFGLGLAIARGAMRAQGGDLSLSTRAEGGTRALVTLPSERATETPR